MLTLASLSKYAALVLCFAWTLLGAPALVPERTVSNHTITSQHDPKVRIQFPPTARYVGGDRFVLYEIADCELHIFAEVDSAGTVQTLYWVQFEGYLASKPELHHTYESLRRVNLGGSDFILDSWVWPQSPPMHQGSDLEHVLALLRQKHYRLPDGMMCIRLVHLLDSEKRKELMIIYAESLAPFGVKASDLEEAGKEHARWTEIEKGLIQRAEQRISVETY
jgi:hypothetical protein